MRQGGLFNKHADAESATDIESRPTLAEPSPAPRMELPAREEVDETTTRGEYRPGKVFVLDAHSLIFQVYHAIAEMTGPAGQPVAAVFGFLRDIFYLIEEKQPDYLFVAFDRSEPTFRHEMYAEYKLDRSEMPDDLVPQCQYIRQAMAVMNIPVLECPGFEADDVLATMGRLVDELGGECYLVTGDKDCRQLITDQVFVYNIRKDVVYDAQALFADWAVRPDQVVDFQSLVGDKIDNVPGVPLIGPKIASELLTKYETLDGLFEHLDEIKQKKRKENLVSHQEQARLSRELVRLDAHVPLVVDWDAGRLGGLHYEQARSLFREFGFRGFTNKIDRLHRATAAAAEWTATYRAVESLEQLDGLLPEMVAAELLSVDVETTSLRAREAELVGISLAWKPGEAWYLPLRAPADERTLPPTETLERLRPLLEDPEVRKIGQNLKYDWIVLKAAGVALRGLWFDTIVASYLLEAGQRTHNLDELSKRFLQHEPIKISQLIGKGKKQKRMDEVPLAEMVAYACEDADNPLRLYPILAERIQQEGLDSLLRDVEMPLVEVLAEMEYEGIQIDRDRLGVLSRLYTERMHGIEQEIFEMADGELNLGSPIQLRALLFEKLKLPVLKKTKTGASTDADVLEELARVHPLPAKLIAHRQYSKLLGTYVDALPELVLPTTGRVHTSFNQVVAATGRLSSNDPNLQNIPIRTDEGREIRSAFVPGEAGWLLLAADYSQIELRVLAHFSRDETLLSAFAEDADIHALVASQVYGVPLDEVTSTQRRSAKAINFGVIYGQTAFGLAKSLGIDRDEAQAFIDAYFDRYPGVDEFMWETLAACREQGCVTTILGRQRAIEGVRDPAKRRELKPAWARQRNLPERTAINTVIQGSAADIIKRAMLDVRAALADSGLSARMLLQIHDELVFEAPAEEIDTLGQLVREKMIAALPLSTPLKVDVKAGPNWAACEAM